MSDKNIYPTDTSFETYSSRNSQQNSRPASVSKQQQTEIFGTVVHVNIFFELSMNEIAHNMRNMGNLFSKYCACGWSSSLMPFSNRRTLPFGRNSTDTIILKKHISEIDLLRWRTRRTRRQYSVILVESFLFSKGVPTAREYPLHSIYMLDLIPQNNYE